VKAGKRAMMMTRPIDITSGGCLVQYKPVLIYVDPDDWKTFQESCGNYKVSKRVRELVKDDIARAMDELTSQTETNR
jgi:hypothetical protein